MGSLLGLLVAFTDKDYGCEDESDEEEACDSR